MVKRLSNVEHHEAFNKHLTERQNSSLTFYLYSKQNQSMGRFVSSTLAFFCQRKCLCNWTFKSLVKHKQASWSLAQLLISRKTPHTIRMQTKIKFVIKLQ